MSLGENKRTNPEVLYLPSTGPNANRIICSHMVIRMIMDGIQMYILRNSAFEKGVKCSGLGWVRVRVRLG